MGEHCLEREVIYDSILVEWLNHPCPFHVTAQLIVSL